jgi:hypothetical protein
VPTGLPIEPLGACSGPSRQPHARTAGFDKDIAGPLKEGAGDATPLIGLLDEQRKNLTAARITGGKADDLAILDPDKDARVVNEPTTSSTVTRDGSRSLFSRTPARISMIRGTSSLVARRIKMSLAAGIRPGGHAAPRSQRAVS